MLKPVFPAARGRVPQTGWEKRQVIEREIRREVIEYQAETVENERGERVAAPFPAGVVQDVQYGGERESPCGV
jgi:hypothetical protein